MSTASWMRGVQDFRRELSTKLRWSLRIGWSTAPSLLASLIGLTLFRGVLPAALALAGRGLLNAVSDHMHGDGGSLGPVYMWLAIGLALALLTALTNQVQSYVRQRFHDEMDLRLTTDILTNAARLEPANFEDPEFRDLFEKARQNPGGNGAFLVTLILSIGMRLIETASLFGILVYLEPLVVPLLLIVGVPYFRFRMRHSRRQVEENLARTQRTRWTGYYSEHLINPGSVGETRMLNLGPLFLKQFRDIRDDFRVRNKHLYRINLIGTALFTVVSLAVVYFAFTRATLHVIDSGLTIGDIALFGAAANHLRSSIEMNIDLVGSLRQQLIFAGIIMDFLDLEPRRLPSACAVESPLRGAIELEDVTFTYPGGKAPVLRDLSLSIAPGEMLALVGHNGSGKTTLAKLIARLYDVDSGSLTIDGRDVREIEPESLHRQMAFVFQNFGCYEATVADNIAYGRWEELLHNREAVEEVARMTGLDGLVGYLPNGYDTRLGRLFGETTLSGGQWQQIAIARTLARQAPIIILDEPTANLDIQAEYRLYQQYRRLARGRTTILISHRFSTVRMADRVAVLADGRIIEHGSHDELLALGGEYATLFQLYQHQMDHGAGSPL